MKHSLAITCAIVVTLLSTVAAAGTPYIGRHGMTASKYQAEFDKHTKAGFRLVHVDGYSVGNDARYAAIWEKRTGPQMVARHGLTGAQYQAEFDKHTKAGYRLVHVDGYAIGNSARYAAIWEKRTGPQMIARHGLTGAQYQAEFDKHAKAGYKLLRVEGYGVGNQALYAAIWEKRSGAHPIARHGMTGSKYQAEFDKHTKAGYRLTYVSAYDVAGKDYYAAIWEKSTGPVWLARHALTASGFQSEFTQRYQEGYRLLKVNGNRIGSSTRYTALWEAQPDALTGSFCGNGQCFDLSKFAGHVESVVKPYATNKVVKYGVEARRGIAVSRSVYGPKRTSATPPAADFTVNDRFNSASVGKTVTAVALLQLLEKRRIDIHAVIHPYLPPSFSIPESSRTVTFAEVLNHSSGFRNTNGKVNDKTGVRYEHVKAVVEAGVQAADKTACAAGGKMPDGTACYQNINYAVARELVASLDGFNDWNNNPGPKSSARFIKYVNDHLFTPIGVFDVKYSADASAPTLFYPYPTGDSKGTAYGNWTEQPGSAGVHASVHELSFFTKGMFEGKLLSSKKLDEAKANGLGIADYGTLPDGAQCFGKGGYFPAGMNGGAELNSVIIACENGIAVAMVINGGKSAKSAVLEALQKSFSPATTRNVSVGRPALQKRAAARTLEVRPVTRNVDGDD